MRSVTCQRIHSALNLRRFWALICSSVRKLEKSVPPDFMINGFGSWKVVLRADATRSFPAL